MPNKFPPDLLTLLIMLSLSAISGVISITQRIARGFPATIVWVVSEFLAAILAGYLAAGVYGHIQASLPSYITMSVFVSACAYSGGRLMHAAENYLTGGLPRRSK